VIAAISRRITRRSLQEVRATRQSVRVPLGDSLQDGRVWGAAVGTAALLISVIAVGLLLDRRERLDTWVGEARLMIELILGRTDE